MAITISVCNHKGGVGKTTTVINLAAALAEFDKRVLVVDLDPQGNSTMVLFPGDPYNAKTAIDLFKNESSMFDNVSQPSRVKNVWIIPTNLDMMHIKGELSTGMRSVVALRNKFGETAQREFDYILLDCPPDLGAFMNNALVISNYYLVPVAAEDKFGLKGLTDIFKMADDIRATTLNPNLKLLGILITLFDSRTNNSKRMEDLLRKQLPDKLLKTTINRNTDLSQANTKDKTVFQHDRRAQGAKDYLDLAKEVIERVEEKRVEGAGRVDQGTGVNAQTAQPAAV